MNNNVSLTTANWGVNSVQSTDSKSFVGDFWEEMKNLMTWMVDPSVGPYTFSDTGVTVDEEDIGTTYFTTALGVWLNNWNSAIEAISNIESFKTELYKEVGQSR